MLADELYSPRVRFGVIAVALTGLACAGGAWGSALAGDVPRGEKDFAYTGREQTFVVPAGVTKITVFAAGAVGGVTDGIRGSDAAWVHAKLGVQPGEKLYVEVGGAGTDAAAAKPCVGVPNCLFASGGFNGGGASVADGGGRPGGGGGGASDLQKLPISSGAPALRSRLIVAAGSGGSGGDGSIEGAVGGRGGIEGANGADGFSRYSENDVVGGIGGEGGAIGPDNAGGKAGAAPSPNPTVYFPGNPGTNGLPGMGGAGGGIARLLPGAGLAAKSISGAGGGGGGGYVGGGGGGSGGIYECGSSLYRCKPSTSPDAGGGGGGGGGSSFTPNGSVGVVGNSGVPPDGSVQIDWPG